VTVTFMGTGGDWTDPSNWVNGLVPHNGDNVVFPPLPNGQTSAEVVTNAPDGLKLNKLTIADGYEISGGTLTIGSGGIVTTAGPNQLPTALDLSGINLSANATINLATNLEFLPGGSLTNAGATSATLTVQGAGQLNFYPQNNFQGTVQVAGKIGIGASLGVKKFKLSANAQVTLGAVNAAGGVVGPVQFTPSSIAAASNPQIILLDGSTLQTGSVTGGAFQLSNGSIVQIGNAATPGSVSGATFDLGPSGNPSTDSFSIIVMGNPGSGEYNLPGNSTLTVNNTSSVTFTGGINDQHPKYGGTLVKDGTGTLTLGSKLPNFAGGLQILNGAVQLGQAGTLPLLGSVTIAKGGKLKLNGDNLSAVDLNADPSSGTYGVLSLGSGTLTLTGSASTSSEFDGTITGSGGLALRGPQTLTLGAGSYQYTGPTTVSKNGILDLESSLSGRLVLGGGGVADVQANLSVGSIATSSGAGVGELVIDAGSELTAGRDGTTTTFSGELTGAGTFAKAGGGKLTLQNTAAGLYTGSYKVGNGALLAVGAIGGSALEVASGATFGGGTSSSGARSAISVGGNVVFDSGSTFAVRIKGTTAGTQYDQLSEPSSAVSLGGSKLSLTTSVNPPVGTVFTIVQANEISGDSVASGQFANAPGGTDLVVGKVAYRIHYTSTAVTLTVVNYTSHGHQ